MIGAEQISPWWESPSPLKTGSPWNEHPRSAMLRTLSLRVRPSIRGGCARESLDRPEGLSKEEACQVAFGRRGARGRAARAPITWPSRPVASGLPGVPAAMASQPCGHARAGRSSPMPSSWARSPRSATGSSDMFMRQPSWNQKRSIRWWTMPPIPNPGRPSRRHAAAALPAAPRHRGEAPRSSQGRVPTQSPGIHRRCSCCGSP
jgi:hypothetical protein